MTLLQRVRFNFYYHALAMLMMAVLVGQTVLAVVPEWNSWIRMVGIILVVVGSPLLLQRHVFPKEVVLFSAFLYWSIMTGCIVADNQELFLDTVQMLVQMYALLLVAFTFFRRYQSLTYCWVLFLVNALFMVLYGAFTEGFSVYSLSAMEHRLNPLSGTSTGANDFGVYAIVGIVSAIALWPRLKLPFQVPLVGFVGILISCVFLSGSRKAFIVLLFMIIVIVLIWLAPSYRRWLRGIPLLLLTIVSVYMLVDYAFTNPVIGPRLQASIDERGDQGREQLYREAIDMFLANPIAGVGLGNFAYHSSYHIYAHSDYAEALAGTGLIGFLLYFSIYPFCFIRLYRAMKYAAAHRQQQRYRELGVVFALLAGYLVLGLGAPNFLDPKAMFFLFATLGYLYALPIRGTAASVVCSRKITGGHAIMEVQR